MERTFLLCLICFILFSFGACGPTDKRGRKDLSDEQHFEGKEHNLQYDHEAFLGKEEAKEFDHLTQEESKRRLGVIADKIDADQDGFISNEELVNWIRHVSHRFVYENVDARIPEYDADKNKKVTLKEYQDKQYGNIEDEDEMYDTHRQLTFSAAKKRDKRKFDACPHMIEFYQALYPLEYFSINVRSIPKMASTMTQHAKGGESLETKLANLADENGDGELDRDEFAAFSHPEDMPRMGEIVVSEAMEDMDRDRDGFVSVEEYINDIWPQWQRNEAEGEPEWLQNERDNVFKYRDLDGDQKLSREELASWISPEGYDPASAEANHLIYHSDTNKDNQLTKSEILDNMEYFVGSQVTNFGSYLNKHDEF